VGALRNSIRAAPRCARACGAGARRGAEPRDQDDVVFTSEEVRTTKGRPYAVYTPSKFVRECLREYFALKDTMALPPDAKADPASTSSAARRSASLFEAVEAATAGALQESERRTSAVLEKLRLLACMLDQAYQGIVVQMAEANPATREARIARATESTKRWRRAVAALYRDGGPEPTTGENTKR
jgi:hypothetical protein